MSPSVISLSTTISPHRGYMQLGRDHPIAQSATAGWALLRVGRWVITSWRVELGSLHPVLRKGKSQEVTLKGAFIGLSTPSAV